MTKVLGTIELGVQSYCYRLFSNEQIVEQLKECGLNALEICRKHLDLDNGDDADDVLAQYRDNGISFNSYGINPYDGDEAKARRYFEFAKKAGISVLGAKPHPDAFDMLGRLCDEYGVKLAIHNHGRKDAQYGTVGQLEAAISRAPESIGLCLDTGWLIDAGEDPAETARKFAGRVYGVHFKDFQYTEDGERLEVVLGEGRLDLPALVKALKETGFNGYATIEYEGQPEQPTPNIVKCIDALVQADRACS